jgi:hypothetical protein
MADEPLNTGEAARRLGLSAGHLTNLRVWGTGPRFQRGATGRVTYSMADLDQWAAAKKQAKQAPTSSIAPA